MQYGELYHRNFYKEVKEKIGHITYGKFPINDERGN